MTKTLIGELVSRIRKQIKAHNKDGFVTDRFIYSLIKKHGAWLIRREDRDNKILRLRNAFQPLDFVELIEVDKVEACCSGITSDCTIKRTKDKLPQFFEGYNGPIIETVASLDDSEEFDPTTPQAYQKIANSKNFKFNKTHYYWQINGYLYFPDVDWDAVKVTGLFQDDVSQYQCETESCVPRQEQVVGIPDYLHAELESHVIKDDMVIMLQSPTDPTFDKQSPLR